MTTKQSPTVREDGLHDSDLPGVLALPHERAKVQSSGWHDWLTNHSKFRFETAKGSFTAFKSNKGYWTAQRRKDGHLRHQYLGESHILTYETLEETARILDAPDYWHKHVSGKGRPREADKELLQKSHNKPYETESSSSQVDDLKEEIRRLQAVISLEKQQKEACQQKLDKAQQSNKELMNLAREARAELERLQLSTSSPDPAAIFNQLRPLLNRLSDRDRRAIQQKLEEVLG